MAFPVASGRTQYSGNFIPEIWSGKLQAKFYKTTIFSEISNNDWEGEISGQGDKVRIRTIPTITINDYNKGDNLTNQVPTSTPVELNIDKGKYFAVVLDDVDAVQTDIKLMDMFTNDATEQMKIAIDSLVLDGVKGSAVAANRGATGGVISGNLNLGTLALPRAVTKSNILDLILDAGQALDEQNVPETGRWIVVPSWMSALIKNSDLKQAYLTGDTASPLRTGKLGMIDRFTVYVSNNLPLSGANVYLMAGTKDAITFASQMSNVETLRAQSTFGNIVRGLNVFGYSVIKPEALVNMVAVKG
ncbi:MAG: hypothetical protein HQ446_06265 [Polaromonas sp.]|nr:hypothetical protein [Polaromonas sp.]